MLSPDYFHRKLVIRTPEWRRLLSVVGCRRLWLRLRCIIRPFLARKSSAPFSCKTKYGSPLSLLQTSRSCQFRSAPMPVPNAFRGCFFSGETRGYVRRCILVAQAILDFVRSKNPRQKMFTQFLERGTNPADFNDVYADAEDHSMRAGPGAVAGSEYFSMSSNISLTAMPSPTVKKRLTMLWPIFNSKRCGTENKPFKF